MPLDTTPGGPNADSYASLVEADAYNDTILYNESWTAADDPTKEIVLKWATRLLDANMDWFGNKATEEQALRFPRYGAYGPDGYQYDSDVIPDQLKEATSEYARLLIEENIPGDANADTFSELAVASIKLKYREYDNQQNSQVLDSVYSLIDFLGTRKTFSGGAGFSINQLSR